MPVLELELSCYPPELLTGEMDNSLQRRWWGVYTKSRQEKALARELLARRVPFYLPLVAQTLVYKRSRVTSHVPMFSGYVFLHGTDEERAACLKTNRVSRLIEVHDEARLLCDLQQVHRVAAEGVGVRVEDRLVPGQRVRVCHGPFAGMEGEIISRHRPTRLQVAIDFIRRGISMEIDDCMVRPLE